MTHLCWSQRVGASLLAYWLKEAGKVHLEGIKFTDKSEHGLSAISLISIQSIILLTAVLAWTPLFPCQPERLLFYQTTAVNQNQRSLITVNLVSGYSADLILRAKGPENNFWGVVQDHTIFCQSLNRLLHMKDFLYSVFFILSVLFKCLERELGKRRCHTFLCTNQDLGIKCDGSRWVVCSWCQAVINQTWLNHTHAIPMSFWLDNSDRSRFINGRLML